jgi:hypothetical protein
MGGPTLSLLEIYSSSACRLNPDSSFPPQILENEEHDIIARLEGLGTGCLYEDTSFPASRGSLYRSSGAVPDYDANVGAIKWMRPHEFSRDPDYFKGGEGAGGIRRGTLDDAWLIGAMALVAAHSGKDAYSEEHPNTTADTATGNLIVDPSLRRTPSGEPLLLGPR